MNMLVKDTVNTRDVDQTAETYGFGRADLVYNQ